jgi:HTH-type transcriptional regulator, sugar sensing transcriptional regulator
MEIDVRKLRSLGLSDYEARTYLSLLQRESLNATEIAKITNIPRTKIYSIINKLEKKNFCTRVPGSSKLYKANNPQDPISKHISSCEKQIENFTYLSDILTEQYQKCKDNNELIDYVEIIKDSDMILERANHLENNSEKKIVCMLKAPFIMDSQKILKETKNPTLEGIKYTYLYDSTVLDDELLVLVLQRYQYYGIDVRICDDIPVKTAIFDDKIVMINLQDKVTTKTSFTAMFIHHEDVARAFNAIFAVYYSQSVPLDDKLKQIRAKMSIA